MCLHFDTFNENPVMRPFLNELEGEKTWALTVSSFFQFSTFLEACLHGGGGPQVGEVTCGGGSTHRSCKRDQIKVRDYMDRRVT